jgi:hypothetical protein
MVARGLTELQDRVFMIPDEEVPLRFERARMCTCEHATWRPSPRRKPAFVNYDNENSNKCTCSTKLIPYVCSLQKNHPVPPLMYSEVRRFQLKSSFPGPRVKQDIKILCAVSMRNRPYFFLKCTVGISVNYYKEFLDQPATLDCAAAFLYHVQNWFPSKRRHL